MQSLSSRWLGNGGPVGTFRENVSLNLSRVLRDLNLSQRDFAKLMEVSEPTAHAWIVGKKAPRPDQFDKIKERLGITPSELTRDAGEESDEVIGFLRDQLASRGYIAFKKSGGKQPKT